MKLFTAFLFTLSITNILCEISIENGKKPKCKREKHCQGIVLNQKLLKKLGYNQDSRVLNLRNLCIESIADDAFHNVQRVVKIDLSFNKIKELKPPVFNGLVFLLVLELNNNHIEHIYPNVFDELVSLKRLNLNFNKLKNLDSPALNPMQSLLEFYCANNQLEDVDWDRQNLPKLRVFDVHSNKLTYLSKCLTQTSLVCFEDEIPSGFVSDLQYLDVSQNNIQNLTQFDINYSTKIAYLNAAYNKIDYIHPKTFQFNGALVEVILDYNKITEIQPGTFTCRCYVDNCVNNCSDVQYIGCQMQLRKLSLSYNEIKQIKRLDFSDLTRLEVLTLSYNKIDRIESNSFSNNMNLRSLRLDYNKLTKIKENTLDGLYSLKWLNLEYNQIVRIEECAFNDLVSVVIICLFDNPINNESKLSEEDNEKELCNKEHNPVCQIKVKEPCKCLE